MKLVGLQLGLGKLFIRDPAFDKWSLRAGS
jgi:hypothetical protein